MSGSGTRYRRWCCVTQCSVTGVGAWGAGVDSKLQVGGCACEAGRSLTESARVYVALHVGTPQLRLEGVWGVLDLQFMNTWCHFQGAERACEVAATRGVHEGDEQAGIGTDAVGLYWPAAVMCGAGSALVVLCACALPAVQPASSAFLLRTLDAGAS